MFHSCNRVSLETDMKASAMRFSPSLLTSWCMLCSGESHKSWQSALLLAVFSARWCRCSCWGLHKHPLPSALLCRSHTQEPLDLFSVYSILMCTWLTSSYGHQQRSHPHIVRFIRLTTSGRTHMLRPPLLTAWAWLGEAPQLPRPRPRGPGASYVKQRSWKTASMTKS